MKLKQEQQREYLFDNYKVLLIILVVIGHFIEPCYDQNSFLYELKWGIVAFHMPAFIFISGYFSKRIPSIKRLIQGLVIPYFVYELVYYFLYTLVWTDNCRVPQNQSKVRPQTEAAYDMELS